MDVSLIHTERGGANTARLLPRLPQLSHMESQGKRRVSHEPPWPNPTIHSRDRDAGTFCIYRRERQYMGDCFQMDLAKVYKSQGKSGLQLQLKAEFQHSLSIKVLFMKVQICPKKAEFQDH